MPSVIGVTVPTSPTVPTSGVIEEATIETTVDIKTITGKDGVVAIAAPAKYKKVVTTIRGYGVATTSFAGMTAGAGLAAGKVSEIKHSESNEDFPKFEVTLTQYAST